MAADTLEVRMARLEGAYEQIDRRLGSLEGQIRDLRVELHDDMHALRTAMRGQFQWLVGLLIFAIFAPIALRLIGH